MPVFPTRVDRERPGCPLSWKPAKPSSFGNFGVGTEPAARREKNTGRQKGHRPGYESERPMDAEAS